MREKFRVVVTDFEYESLKSEEQALAGIGATLIPCHCKDESELISSTADADALLVQYASITRRVIEHMSKCQIIVRYGIGVDSLDVPAATDHGIIVANVPDYGLEEVANHTISLLLASARKLTILNESVKSGVWNYKVSKPLFRLSGKVLGLLAFGNIARLVAKKALAFGLQVQVCDPFIDAETAGRYHAKLVDFDTLIATSDFLSIHAPGNSSTYHLFNQSVFSRMKSTSYLINTARGAIIDEQALIDALTRGAIAGAALDVSEQEPISPTSKLLQLPNVIITPHAAWYTEEAQESVQGKAAAEVARVLSGQPPQNLVNPDVMRNPRLRFKQMTK
ncbi:MAG: C-terminal binding protein [Firmicutes bacterium]|nr:C-terminal binding protein [Bacillota bacterium]